MKIRNLLDEFQANHGLRPPTILGVREHVFTGRFGLLFFFFFFLFNHQLSPFPKIELHEISYAFLCWIHICSVSSLAWFMSNQETSFVTLGQRVLANPLK